MIKKSVDLVIPIYYRNYDEIEVSLKKIHDFFTDNLKNYNWNIIIGLNGPNKNNIFDFCKKLATVYSRVYFKYTSTRGRGATLNDCWTNSNSDYVSYMDVDLSTDLRFFSLMIKKLDEGCDVSVGSRYLPQSKKQRSFFRYFISKVYNHIFLKVLLNVKFTDSQCGFKSMKTDVAKKIIPLMKDINWFWDTEILYICQKKRYVMNEIPIVWNEKQNSGVKFIKTILDFILKSFELKFRKI